MAKTGYASALGSLAKDAVVGAGKGFVGGLKGAMISEAPGIAGAYAFGKELRSRANAPKMPSGGSAPPSATNKPSSSNSPMTGGLGTTNDKSIVAILRQSNIINLEQVRQLKQLNDNVINQSKLLKFTVDDTKRKDQFAEEVAKEQAFRDDRLLDAIKRIGSSDNKKQTKADDKKESSFLGNLVDLISDNIGKLITGYLGIKYGGKVLGALGAGGALGGMAGRKALGGMAGRALPQGAISVLDASGKVIAGAGAKSALVESIATVVPMVLRFLTGPIGLGIMAAAGMFALLKTASNPDYDPKDARSGKSRVDNTGAQDSKRPLTQADAKAYLEDANKRKTNDPNLTSAQNKTKIDNADRTLNEYGGRQRVENVAKGLPEYSMPATGTVSSLQQDMRDLKDGKPARPHHGVDYAMPPGTYISPIRPGKVDSFDSDGTKSTFGRHVIVDHGEDIKSTYAHLSEVSVNKVGQEVDVNTLLGYSGGAPDDKGAGHAKGAHLHLEIKQGGKFLKVADLPGLEASKELNRSVSRGMYNAAKTTAAKTTAADAAGELLPTAKPGTRSDYGMTMRPAGSSAAVLFGQEKYNKHLLPENPPIPIEADAPYFKRQALIAEQNKKNDQLNKASQGLDGKSADPKVTEELINKLKEDVKNLNEKIEDAKSLDMVLDEAGFAMAASVDAAMKRLGNLSPDEQKAVFSKMNDSVKEYEKELKKIFERIEGLKKLKDDPKKAKSEILNLIKDINKFWDNLFVPAKAPVVPKTSVSNVLGDGELSAEQRAIYGMNSPLFAKTNMQADPNARIVASLDSFLPDGGLTNINNTAGVEVVSKESNPFVKFIERLLVMFRGGRSSPVKLGSDYVDNMDIDDLFRKEERDYRVVSDASNKLALDSFDKLASGTKYDDGKSIRVVDEELNRRFKNAKFGEGTGGTGKALKTFVAPGGNLILSTAPPPFKPEFKSNSDILADANKQFLKELRSTLTGIFNTELNKALLPNGVGVSASEAGRDDMYRGEQLKKINDTSKKINEGAIDLFGKKFGPMFAPMLDKLSTSYFEVGARSVGKAIFQGIGNLGGKETMSLTGQVLGNYASGKKELAFEQLLYGMSGGQKSGVALGAETLFAKYGFKDPMEGISYYANALGEKATQYTQLPKLMGADDRSKSIIFEPRSGKFLNVDTGKYATQPEIDAANKDYGSRVSQTPMIPSAYDNFGMPGAPYSTIAGQRGGVGDNAYQTYQINNSAGVAGAGSVFKQVLNQKPGQETITRAQIAGKSEEEFARGGEKTIAAQNTQFRVQAKLLNEQNNLTAKIAIDEAKLQHKLASEAASNAAEQADADAALQTVLNDAKTSTDKINAEDIIAAVKRAAENATESGSDAPGLKKSGSGRKPGQLFDSNTYDENGKIDGKDPMKEIGNFGFDMLKLAGGNALTKGIDNPYMKMIADFAIQKGMNAGIEAIMGTGGDGGIFSKIGSMFSSSSGGYGGSSSYGGVGDIFSSALKFIGFKDGGLVQRRQTGGVVVGAGTGTSDSIPAMLSNGEFVVNAKAAAAHMKLLNAINQSTLPKKTTAGSGTDINERGGGDGDGSSFGGSNSGLGVGPGQGVSTSTQSVALAVMAFADKYPGWAPFGTVVQIAGWLAGKAADSQMEKMDNAMKAIDAIDKTNAVALESGSSRTFDPYNGTKGVLSVSDKDGNVKSFDPYAGDSAKDSGRKAGFDPHAGDSAKDKGKLSSTISDTLAAAIQSSADYGKTSWGKTGNIDQDIGGSFTPFGGASTAESTSVEGGDLGAFLAKGGLITGKGSGTSDSIFAMLSNGEFVINAKATKANLSILKQINSYTGSGSVSKAEYDSNLSIEPFKNTFKGFADGGLVTPSTMNAVPRPTSRSPYILSPPTNNSSSENQNNSSNMIIGPKTSTRIDNSSVTNFYNQASGMIDSIRSITPQVA